MKRIKKKLGRKEKRRRLNCATCAGNGVWKEEKRVWGVRQCAHVSADWLVTLVTAAYSPVECDVLTGARATDTGPSHLPATKTCSGFCPFLPPRYQNGRGKGRAICACAGRNCRVVSLLSPSPFPPSTDVVSLLSTVHRVVQNPAQTSQRL